MAIYRDYYLNDRQYERLMDLLNSLNVDLVGHEKDETVDEMKRLFTEQMSDHKSIGDTNYSDIARSLRIALNEWMEDVRKFPDEDCEQMEDIINETMKKFLDRQSQMSEKYSSDDT